MTQQQLSFLERLIQEQKDFDAKQSVDWPTEKVIQVIKDYAAEIGKVVVAREEKYAKGDLADMDVRESTITFLRGLIRHYLRELERRGERIYMREPVEFRGRMVQPNNF